MKRVWFVYVFHPMICIVVFADVSVGSSLKLITFIVRKHTLWVKGIPNMFYVILKTKSLALSYDNWCPIQEQLYWRLAFVRKSVLLNSTQVICILLGNAGEKHKRCNRLNAQQSAVAHPSTRDFVFFPKINYYFFCILRSYNFFLIMIINYFSGWPNRYFG